MLIPPRVRIPSIDGHAGVAQLAEQSPCKRKRAGSKPAAGSRYVGLAQLGRGVVRKARRDHHPEIVGSIPVGVTIFTDRPR